MIRMGFEPMSPTDKISVLDPYTNKDFSKEKWNKTFGKKSKSIISTPVLHELPFTLNLKLKHLL